MKELDSEPHSSPSPMTRPVLLARSAQSARSTVVSEALLFMGELVWLAIAARLILPVYHGVFAMATTAIALANVVYDGGLSYAAVQSSKLTHQQASALFWVNTCLGFVACIVVIAVSPLVAWLYGEPRVISVVAAASLSLIAHGIRVQPAALLQREMAFSSINRARVAGFAGGLAGGAVTAWLGWGIWALVVMVVTRAWSELIALLLMTKWRPAFTLRGAGTRGLLRFGSQVFLSQVFNQIRAQLDVVLIGAVWGPAPMAYYRRAYQLLMQPIGRLSRPANKLVLPALCRCSHNDAEYTKMYSAALSLMLSVLTPLVIFCYLCAEDIILVLLGPDWRASIPIFRWLAPAAAIRTLVTSTAWIYIPRGLTHLQVRATALRTVAYAVALSIGVVWGPIGVAVAFVIVSTVTRLIEFVLMRDQSPITIRHVFGPLLLCSAIALPGFVAAYALSGGFDADERILRLAVRSLIFFTLYATVLLATGFGRQQLRNASRIMTGHLGKEDSSSSGVQPAAEHEVSSVD